MISDAVVGSVLELRFEGLQLLIVLVRLLQSFVCDPARTLHELDLLEVAAVGNGLNRSDSLLEDFVLFVQESALTLSLVVSEDVLDLVGLKVVFALVETSNSVLFLETLCHQFGLKVLLELHDFYIVLVSNSGDFFQVSVLKNGMCISEEVVDDES